MALKVGDLFVKIGLRDGDFQRGMKRVRASLAFTAKSAMAMAKGGGWFAIGAGMAHAAVQALALVHNLAPLAGLAGAMPALLGSWMVATQTLKLGVSGLTDALKGKKDALEKLSPAARSVYDEIQGQKKAWDGVRAAVETGIFTNVQGQIAKLGGTYLPILTQRLGNIGKAWGSAFAHAAEAARSSVVVQGVTRLLDATHLALARVGNALGPLVRGFGAAFGAGAPFVEQLGAAIEKVATAFGTWLEKVSTSGQLATWVQGGIAVLKQLWTIVSQLGQLLFTVFQAAGAAGGDVLGVFGLLLTAANQFLSSAQGMSVLSTIFSTIQATFAAIAPALQPILGALGSVVVAIAPLLPIIGQLVGIIGTALAGAVQALVPGLTLIVNALVAGLSPILPVITQAFSALMPLIGQIGTLLGQVLAQAVAAIVPMLLQMIPMWLQLAQTVLPLLMPILTVVGQLFTALMPVMMAIAQVVVTLLVAAFQALAPVFNQLLPLIGTLVSSLLPLLIPLVQMVGQVFMALMPALTPLIQLIVLLLTPILQLVAVLVGALMPVLTFLVSIIATVVGWIAQAVGAFVSFLISAQTWSSLGTFFVNLWNGIIAVFNAAVAFIVSLPGRIWAGLQALPGLLMSVFMNGAKMMLFAVGYAIGATIRFFMQLPGRLWALSQAAWRLVVSAVSAGIAAVLRFVSTLPGRVASFVSTTWSRAKAGFSSGVSAVAQVVSTLPGKVMAFISSIPGRISAAASSFMSAARDIGSRIIDGLIGGIKGAVGKAVDAVKGAVGSIISGAKKGLGIASPSKVAASEVGRWIPPGIGEGFKRAVPRLRQQIDAIMPSILPTAALAGPGMPAQWGPAPAQKPVVVKVRESGDTVNFNGSNVTLRDWERHQRRKEVRARVGRAR